MTQPDNDWASGEKPSRKNIVKTNWMLMQFRDFILDAPSPFSKI